MKRTVKEYVTNLKKSNERKKKEHKQENEWETNSERVDFNQIISVIILNVNVQFN